MNTVKRPLKLLHGKGIAGGNRLTSETSYERQDGTDGSVRRAGFRTNAEDTL